MQRDIDTAERTYIRLASTVVKRETEKEIEMRYTHGKGPAGYARRLDNSQRRRRSIGKRMSRYCADDGNGIDGFWIWDVMYEIGRFAVALSQSVGEADHMEKGPYA